MENNVKLSERIIGKDPKKVRKWDIYFLKIAREVSKNSKCLSRQIGAVLVKDKSIISTGYNGPARGVKHCGERLINFYFKLNKPTLKEGEFYFNEEPEAIPDNCPRKILGYKSGQGLHLCQAGHAERNALIQAGRNGISTLNTTLYCWCPLPCMPCIIEIINAGVNTLVFLEGPEYDNYSKTILDESGINIRKIKMEDLDGNK